MFFSEEEGHMQKLSSFGRGKKFGLNSHLRGPSTQPFNRVVPESIHTPPRKVIGNFLGERSHRGQTF